MEYEFVPEGFIAPEQIETDDFIIRKLTVYEVEKDYKAVMSSKESLRQVFSEDDDWPADDMTIDDNYNDLLRHQEEFENNEAFAYTVVTTDDSECIGCIYIRPFPYGVYDSKVYYWLVDDVVNDLDETMRSFLDKWIPDSFGLIKPVYPGRDMTHSEWEKLEANIKAHTTSN
jgi:hypothetical protein